MKKLVTIAALAVGLAVTGACSPATTAKPIPQSGAIETTTTTIPAPAPVAKAAAVVTTTTTTEAVKVTSCDTAREALLTGTPAQISSAMAGLIADRSADGTAREYADYYLHRDATDPSMRSMDVGLIRMSCS